MILSRIFDFFFPEECVVCRIHPAESAKNYICRECESRINEIDIYDSLQYRCRKCSCLLISEVSICIRCRSNLYSFNSNSSIWGYESVIIKKLIHNYKFSGKKKSSIFLAAGIYEIYKNKFKGRPIVPAPCSRKRIKKYGWDHMKVISEVLEKKYGIEIFYLFKKKKTRDQKELNYEDRQKSLQNKIILNHREAEKCLKKSRNIVIIDDVFTTGATSDYCSRLLISSKFDIIDIITIAID